MNPSNLKQLSFANNPKFRLALILIYFAQWLLQKICTTILSDQIQIKTNRDSVTRVFPRFKRFICFHWLLVIFCSVLIGYCFYFGFGFCDTQLLLLSTELRLPVIYLVFRITYEYQPLERRNETNSSLIFSHFSWSSTTWRPSNVFTASFEGSNCRACIISWAFSEI